MAAAALAAINEKEIFMAIKPTKSHDVTPEVKSETPKVVISEASKPVEPDLPASTKAEMEAGRAALLAHSTNA